MSDLAEILKSNSPAKLELMSQLPSSDLLLLCRTNSDVEQHCKLENNFWKKKFQSDFSPTYDISLFVDDWYNNYKFFHYFIGTTNEDLIEVKNSPIIKQNIHIWNLYWYYHLHTLINPEPFDPLRNYYNVYWKTIILSKDSFDFTDNEAQMIDDFGLVSSFINYMEKLTDIDKIRYVLFNIENNNSIGYFIYNMKYYWRWKVYQFPHIYHSEEIDEYFDRDTTNFFILFQHLFTSSIYYIGKGSSIFGYNIVPYLITIQNPQLATEWINVEINEDDPLFNFGDNIIPVQNNNNGIKKIITKNTMCIIIDFMNESSVTGDILLEGKQFLNIRQVITGDIYNHKFMVIDDDNIIYHFDSIANIQLLKDIYNEEKLSDYNTDLEINMINMNEDLSNRYDYIKLKINPELIIQDIRYIQSINTDNISIIAFTDKDMYISSSENNSVLYYAMDMKNVGFNLEESDSIHINKLLISANNTENLLVFLKESFKTVMKYDMSNYSFWETLIVSFKLDEDEFIDKIYTLQTGYNIILTTKKKKIFFYIVNESKNENKFIDLFHWLFMGVNNIDDFIYNDLAIYGVLSKDMNNYVNLLSDYILRTLEDVKSFVIEQKIEYYDYENYLQQLYTIFKNDNINITSLPLEKLIYREKTDLPDLFVLNFQSLNYLLEYVNYGNDTTKVMIGKSNHFEDEILHIFKSNNIYKDKAGNEVDYTQRLYLLQNDGSVIIIDMLKLICKYQIYINNIDDIYPVEDGIFFINKGYEYSTIKEIKNNKDSLKYCTEVNIEIHDEQIVEHYIRCKTREDSTIVSFPEITKL